MSGYEQAPPLAFRLRENASSLLGIKITNMSKI